MAFLTKRFKRKILQTLNPKAGMGWPFFTIFVVDLVIKMAI
jgi:hypothetical protein